MGKMLLQIEKSYKIAIILVDLVVINVAYILAFIVKFGWQLPKGNFLPYMEAMPFITVAALVYLDIFGLLKFYRKSLYDAILPILSVVSILGITTVTITYFNQGFAFPRSVLLMTPIFQFVLLACWYGIILSFKKHFTGKSSVMIIGYEHEVDSLMDKVLYSADMEVKYVCNPEEMRRISKRLKEIDQVLICHNVSDEFKMKIISHCISSRKVVYVVPELFEISLMNARLVHFEDVPAFMIDGLDLSTEQKFFKRVFDVVLSFLGLVLTLPLFMAIVPIIRMTSEGKAMYSQRRVTKNNKVFRIYKFRTMYENAESLTGPVISSENDPRITPVGRILRKLRLDELPQLFNVLIGDMSIVGPRPERPVFVEQFARNIPEYNNRSIVKAGITGYAQIFGKYDTSPEDKLRYDLMYIKNYSLLLDIKLLFQTVRVLFMGKNMFQKDFSKGIKEDTKAMNF